jgi:hypothetical protein
MHWELKMKYNNLSLKNAILFSINLAILTGCLPKEKQTPELETSTTIGSLAVPTTTTTAQPPLSTTTVPPPTPTTVPPPTPTTTQPPAPQVLTRIYLMNYAQIYQSLWNATSVHNSQHTNPPGAYGTAGASLINLNVYATRELRLRESIFPIDAPIEKVTGPHLLANINLAGAFCSLLIEQERADTVAGYGKMEGRILKNIKLYQGPKNISDLQLASVVRGLARSIWGRNETPEELTEILNFSKDYIRSLSPTQASDFKKTTELLVLTCSAVYGSLESIVQK